MKIRKGFVSNSSSSSFVAYGVIKEDDTEIMKAIKKVKPNASWDDVYDDLEELLDSPLTITIDNNGVIYIGGCYSDMEQNETRKEFEKRSKQAIESFFGHKVKCEVIDKVIGE